MAHSLMSRKSASIGSRRCRDDSRGEASLPAQAHRAGSMFCRVAGVLAAIYMSQAPSPIRAYYRKLVKQLVYGALTD
jgi:hypothetical protein